MCIRALQILMLFLPLVALPIQAQASAETPTVDDISRAELDQMLAPIALYPDTVLSHVLIAATYPLEIIQAHRWSQDNSHLDAAAAVKSAEKQDWDPSVTALTAFPDLLQRMSDDIEWTQRLGEAFLVDESRVMDVIQTLREKAYAAGSLDSMKHIQVQREERTIIIEPAVERIVYIPYYDTRVVYGNWWWSDYPPRYWRHPQNHVYIGGYYWGPRVSLGSTFFFTSFHWPQRRVVHIDYRGNHYPRLYSSRKIARFDHARHWRHNPVHRRGVNYRYNRLQERYHHHATTRNLQDRRRVRQADHEDRHTITSRNHAARPGRSVMDSKLRDKQSTERSRFVRERLGGNSAEVEPKSTGRPRLHQSRPVQENAARPGRTTRPRQSEQSASTSPNVRFGNREHNDRVKRDDRSARRDAASKTSDRATYLEQRRERQSAVRSSPRPARIERTNRPGRDLQRPAPSGRSERGPSRRIEGRPTRER